MAENKKDFVYEILYEESQNGVTSHIPFIAVPKDCDMPRLLFIFESRETDQMEPGLNGDDVPVVEMDLHQYADMNFLKTKIDPDTYDRIRACLGLKPVKEAAVAGSKITESIRNKVQK